MMTYLSSMNSEEIKNQIEKVIEWHYELNAITENLYPSKVWEVMMNFCGEYVMQVAHRIGDNNGWLEWFMYENEVGAREFEATPNRDKHPLKKICTVDDVVWLIEESK